MKNKYGESVGAIIQLVGIRSDTSNETEGSRTLTPQKTQGGNEGDGLGGLGHSGPLVTISSPSVIVKPLVAAQPPQPPPAYTAAEAPSHQHQQRPTPKRSKIHLDLSSQCTPLLTGTPLRFYNISTPPPRGQSFSLRSCSP